MSRQIGPFTISYYTLNMVYTPQALLSSSCLQPKPKTPTKGRGCCYSRLFGILCPSVICTYYPQYVESGVWLIYVLRFGDVPALPQQPIPVVQPHLGRTDGTVC